jgi:ribosome-interacting GTPase 1
METLQRLLDQMRIKAVGQGFFPSLDSGWVSKRTLVLMNKCDAKNAMETYRILEARLGNSLPLLLISAKEEMNLEELKKEIYQLLDIIRVYTKIPGQTADVTEPVVMKKGSTIEDVALSVHKDFMAKLRYAKIWGSGKFDGQMVKRDFEVNEGDVIELHI